MIPEIFLKIILYYINLYVNGTYGTNYGIHGNNNESSIGNHVSGGCIRMHNAEIRWLFDQIEIGSEAIIKYIMGTG